MTKMSPVAKKDSIVASLRARTVWGALLRLPPLSLLRSEKDLCWKFRVCWTVCFVIPLYSIPRNDGGLLCGAVWSVFDEFLDGFVGKAHVGAELVNGEDLMCGFVEGRFYFQNETAAVALTFAGDALDIFGVNAEGVILS